MSFDPLPDPYVMIQAIGPVGGWEFAKGMGTNAAVSPFWQLFLRPEGGEWVKGQATSAQELDKAFEELRRAYLAHEDIDYSEWIAPPPPVNWGRFG